VRRDIRTWYRSIGVQTPTDRPAWCSATSIYEVMIGSAPFRGDYHYAPYPAFQDLIADLDRVADLGFDCLQLMPHHPYPSYNIHQPGDVATTYATPDELRQLVDACHRRGLRIVLDILLHGVVDKQIVEKTARLVRNGPHAKHLDDPCLDIYGEERVEISWCRHILEFEPHWRAAAPDRHPLLEAHPDWFMRDSQGAITGRYTHALDIANDDWQECFTQTCEALVRDYSIDGFRFDAPFYNLFANWSPRTRRHASYSNLGYVQLLHRLRPRLHAISPDVILYTEPSGPLARESLDLNYGYPESWLIGSLFDDRLDPAHEWRRVSTGKELASWFRDFDATLPPGSVTTHFVDCHDTIWWRLPGDLWRRQQVGLHAAKALLAIYGLRGGGYLTCSGGETGVEAELKRLHALRTRLPEIRDGAIDYTSVDCDQDAIYAVLRRDQHRATLVAVNTSAQPIDARMNVDSAAIPGPIIPTALDAWTGEWLPTAAERGADNVLADRLPIDISFQPYQAHVLVLGHPPRDLWP
jgi:Alpha amylase, catalytic domain